MSWCDLLSKELGQIRFNDLAAFPVLSKTLYYIILYIFLSRKGEKKQGNGLHKDTQKSLNNQDPHPLNQIFGGFFNFFPEMTLFGIVPFLRTVGVKIVYVS